MITKLLSVVSFLILGAGLVFAQTPSPTPTADCPAPIYSPYEVSKKAKIIFFPPPERPKDKRAKEIAGIVVVHVVLCRTGQVTDVQAVQKLPYGITQSAIDAAKHVRFNPAEKDGKTVSQRAMFQYRFDAESP